MISSYQLSYRLPRTLKKIILKYETYRNIRPRIKTYIVLAKIHAYFRFIIALIKYIIHDILIQKQQLFFPKGSIIR